VPDTPAGRQLSAWLEAFNTGDRATVQQFIDKTMPGRPVEPALAIRAQSGGFDFKKVEQATDARIVALLQERAASRQFMRISIEVAADAVDRIAGLGLAPAQPPPELAPAPLTDAELAAARATPAFRQFSAWLDAINSGDRARIEQYLQTNYPSANLEVQMGVRERSGGFDLRKIEQATAETLVGLVEERGSDRFGRFTLVVEPNEPYRITRLGILPTPRPPEFPIARLSESELTAALRAKLETDAANDRFAGAVLVARIVAGKPRLLFREAYGLADRETKMPNRVETRFRIGSMNKMFTAMAIVQLAQAGKIDLTAPVGRYIKDYPNQEVAAKATIHELLTHTGGTGDFFGPDYESHRLELRTLDDYLRLFGGRSPEFEPGSRWAYSNFGMIILGVVVERVSGQSYYDYVAKNVYKRAGMTRSGSEPESEGVAGRATGYMRARGASGLVPNTSTLGYRGTSAGGGYSTVDDLLAFAIALLSNRLLDAEHTQLLITGKVSPTPPNPLGGMYAYGFEDGRTNGVGAVGHNGGAPGMNGELRIYPQSGYVVAVLANLDPPAASDVYSFIDARLPR
jgi:D-alanyl-D-alanine carboxypeptidase